MFMVAFGSMYCHHAEIITALMFLIILVDILDEANIETVIPPQLG
jgi:hypothetical protein